MEFKVKRGDVITIAGYSFPITKRQTVTVTGTEYSKDQFESYKVSFPDLKVPKEAYESQMDFVLIDGVRYNLNIIHTSTDIGGCNLWVNDKPMAFLHNGFGDGNYRLKFINGCLYR